MMYNTGDYVRLESSNPYKMKIDIKESLGEDLTLSDFGKEDVVLSSLVDYLTDEDNSDKLEKFINDLTEDMEIDMDMW